MTRFTKRASALPLILLLAASAHAGHWEVVYTGGFFNDSAGLPHADGSLPSGAWGGQGPSLYGAIKAKFTWTKDYVGDNSTPPPVVFVRETCSASSMSTTPAAAPKADNGLGSTKTTSSQSIAPGYIRTQVWCSGTRLTRQEVNGANPVFEVTASPSASGSDGYGGGASVSYSAAISPYGVSIFSDRDTTYFKSSTTGRTANPSLVFSDMTGDSVIARGYYDQSNTTPTGTWICAPTFGRSIVGPWNNPYNAWAADPEHWEDTAFSEIESVTPTQWRWTLDQAKAMVLNGPSPKVCSVTVTDNGGSGESRRVAYTMRVHAPYEQFARDSSTKVYVGAVVARGRTGAVPGPTYIGSNEPFGPAMTTPVTSAVNTSNSSAPELLEFGVKATTSATYGETANIAKLFKGSYQVPAGSYGRIFQQAYYKRNAGHCDYYLANGFGGVGNWEDVCFWSGSAAAAEMTDFDEWLGLSDSGGEGPYGG